MVGNRLQIVYLSCQEEKLLVFIPMTFDPVAMLKICFKTQKIPQKLLIFPYSLSEFLLVGLIIVPNNYNDLSSCTYFNVKCAPICAVDNS